MNQFDNLGVLQRFVDDKKVGITFQQFIDAEDETIIAEVYFKGGSLVDTVNATGFSTTGGLKGAEKTVTCDFSSIPVGDSYTIKFKTEESGVLARGGLVMFAEDAFSTVALTGATPSDDAATLYQPKDADLSQIAALSPAVGDYLEHTGSAWALKNIGDQTRFNTDTTISAPGTYVFYGSTERTVTFADSINGPVRIITEASAQLNFSGNFHSGFRGYMRANTAMMTFLWNGTNQYNF